VQFSYPTDSYQTLFEYPIPPDVRKQCDIVEAFSYEFPPFVPGCNYQVENHYTVSENTEYVTDVLKRYATMNATLPTGLTGNVLPMQYNPDPRSIQAQLRNSFLFHRGGVSYKLYNPITVPTVANAVRANYTVRAGPVVWGMDPTMGFGSPVLPQGDQNDEMTVSVPWQWYLPYLVQGQITPNLTADPMYAAIHPNAGDPYATFSLGNPLNPKYVFTCVRDDYAVGFLVPPPELPSSENARKIPQRAPYKVNRPSKTEAFIHVPKIQKPKIKIQPVGPPASLRKGFFGA